MFRYPLLAMALSISTMAFGQLSKGEGQSVTIPGNQFSCYLPKYFEVQAEPPGVIHKASGTFIIAVKVPPGKKVSMQEGLQRSFFEDSRYEILSLTEEKNHQTHGPNSRSYLMRYKLEGFEFERYTSLIGRGQDQYLIIGNYSMILKEQVLEEVKKVMTSFIIL